MLEDEDGTNKVKEAKHREDAYLEEQIRRADEDRMKEQEDQSAHRKVATEGVPSQCHRISTHSAIRIQ